jgi:predicted phosphodiesterase
LRFQISSKKKWGWARNYEILTLKRLRSFSESEERQPASNSTKGGAMDNRRPYHLIIWLIIILPCFIGCNAFIGRYPPSFYSGDEQQYFEQLIFRNRTQFENQIVHQLASDDDLRVVGADPDFKTEALNAPLLVRFAWFSDVQLRQREVKLFSEKASRNLDDIIPTFEHNFVQEDFDWAVYLSLVAATNRLHLEKPLDFMIHTGDSIDAGTIEELYQFIYISDQLRIPWLNIVGNHDVAIFGNYREQVSYTRQAGVNFYPVGNVENFVWMHRKERKISGFGRHLLPTPSEGGHPPSENTRTRRPRKIPPTFHHGFDLILGQACDKVPPVNLSYEEVPGFYAAELCATAIPMRLIAMNTAKTEDWGADANVNPAQRRWLMGALLPVGEGINLLFSHHRPDGFDPETKALLASSENGPVVMFTGHTHQHHLKEHPGPNGSAYFELNTGAVLEYPQTGRLIELRGSPQGDVWLISRALWTNLMSVGNMPSKTEVDTTLAECRNQREAKREISAEAVKCGHYGALDDYWKGKKRAWGRPQSLSEGWQEANVIIPIRR